MGPRRRLAARRRPTHSSSSISRLRQGSWAVAFLGAVGVDHEPYAANGQRVAVIQEGLGDLLTVDEGPIGAAEILELELVAVAQREAAMHAGYERRVDYEIRPRRPSQGLERARKQTER